MKLYLLKCGVSLKKKISFCFQPFNSVLIKMATRYMVTTAVPDVRSQENNQMLDRVKYRAKHSTEYGHEKSNESVKDMDGTFAGWSGMV